MAASEDEKTAVTSLCRYTYTHRLFSMDAVSPNEFFHQYHQNVLRIWTFWTLEASSGHHIWMEFGEKDNVKKL